jgi:hypothetical protein
VCSCSWAFVLAQRKEIVQYTQARSRTGQVVANPVSAGQVELHSLNPEPTYYYNNSSSFPQPVSGGVSSSMAQVGTPFGSVPSAPPVYASGGFATGYAVVPGNREHSM